MVSSKAKEERILGVSDPTRTQLPDICAEENTRTKICRPPLQRKSFSLFAEAKVKKTLLKS